jgi:hypothetical protein
MANVVISRTEEMSQVIDEVYKQGAKTSDLDYTGILVEATKDAKTFRIAKRALEGLGDYKPANAGSGYPSRDVSMSYETHTFSQDRGAKMEVDYQDELESGNTMVGHKGIEEVGNIYSDKMTNLIAQFEREKVVTEVDAYTFAVLSDKAGTTATPATLTASTVKAAVDSAIENLNEKEVIEENRILYFSNEVYTYFKNADLFDYNLDSRGSNNNQIDTRVASYDGIKIIKVPRSRFFTKIDIFDGVTAGQEAGGYAKATAGLDINFLLVNTNAIAKITKQDQYRIWSPTQDLVSQTGSIGVWQDSNSFTMQYRRYYDVFVWEQKVDGIYLHNKAS